MFSFSSDKVVAIGEAMVELAPIGEGLYQRGFAGDTFNTAWHMAQALAGKRRVGFVSKVGQDKLSDAFLAELKEDGLDTSFVGRETGRTMGLYMIELNGVERSFRYWRKDTAAGLLAENRAWLVDAVEGAGLIHLSGITIAILSSDGRQRLLDVLAEARSRGAIVSLDPNIRPNLWSSPQEVRNTISGFLGVTDIALPSFDDEYANWGDAVPDATLDRFAGAGVSEVVVKNGAGPVSVLSEGRKRAIDTPAVSEIRDTTGAGDAFNAGYLAARLTGRDPAAAVEMGQKMSGTVIRHFGARIPKSAIPAFA